MHNSDYEKLLNYSFRLLSKKRYTVFEIERKLKYYSKRRAINEEDNIDKVIKRLFDLKYLNDQEYVNDFINSRIKFKPRGKFLIKKELILKGVKKELIDEIMNKDLINEEDIGSKLIEKNMYKWTNLDKRKRREKAFQLLSRKGIAVDSIYKILDNQYNRHVKVES